MLLKEVLLREHRSGPVLGPSLDHKACVPLTRSEAHDCKHSTSKKRSPTTMHHRNPAAWEHAPPPCIASRVSLLAQTLRHTAHSPSTTSQEFCWRPGTVSRRTLLVAKLGSSPAATAVGWQARNACTVSRAARSTEAGERP